MAVVPFTRYFKPSIQVKLGLQPTDVQTLAGVPDPTTIENINGTGIRIRFRVRKSITSSANTAEIDVFNMDERRVTPVSTIIASTGKAPISVSVGYDNVVGRIFSGDIKRLDSKLVQPPDVITRIKADDAGDEINEIKLAVTAPAASVDQLVNLALRAFTQLGNRPIKIAKSASSIIEAFRSRDMPFPIAHVGRASDLLDEAARMLEARWWIDGGELHMAKLGRPMDNLAVVLDTERLFSDVSNDVNGFVRFKTFCDPNIVPGRHIKIGPSIYRVHMVEYSGDTFGGAPWAADVVAWDSVL